MTALPLGTTARTLSPAPATVLPSSADPRPLKVLLTTDWWEPTVNGVVASVTTLKRELELLGCEVRVLTLAEGLRSTHADGVYRLGSVSASIFYDRARIGALSSDAIRREILRWGPDIVHSNCEFSTYLWAKRLSRDLGVPIVHTYHTIYEDYTHYYSPSRTMGKKAVAAFSRKLLAGTDAVIAPTTKVSALLAGYGVRRPIHVVPTGLDLRRFRPARTVAEREDAQALRRELRIPETHRVLVSVCRLAKEKNIEEVLRNVAAARRTDCTLVLVGDGPIRADAERLAEQLGIGEDVRFVGCVDPAQIPRYYRLGDVFVSASLSETQGLTFIEALACGLPLLCRRDPSLAGVVLDGITGWQYEEAGEFAYRLSDLLDHDADRARMSRSAAAHAHETCGSDAFGRGALEVYRDVIAARRPARAAA
ncbi:glycosyltransferase family 4 protein [Brachybacterium huguangmaarense]|uniref:D-inositol 3-phosphate glycosyltransferase n=1 Tax=Brachybacterium huguangmaarense TaxID=1652028 RepID=A0ABY6G241_9MICO|nr:glycosyltransferase family 4 protein [Brachybacterium huguangmaarense]UYG16729.1 glycosyltransferase family 4 protein [Brachybacterium huguangmaarense]